MEGGDFTREGIWDTNNASEGPRGEKFELCVEDMRPQNMTQTHLLTLSQAVRDKLEWEYTPKTQTLPGHQEMLPKKLCPAVGVE